MSSHVKYGKIAAIVLLLVILTGVGLAKYIHRNDTDGYVRAQQFYFSGELLDGETHVLASGTTSFTFEVGNHEDALRYSEMDIKYEVKVEPSTDITVRVDTSSDETESAAGLLRGGKISDQSVTISNLQAGTTYTVTATGENGYYKSLTAQIYVSPETSAVYKYLDTFNKEYVLLTVWTQKYSGSVQISFPKNVTPDNTDSIMTSIKSTAESFVDESSFAATGDHAGDYTSHVYRFFGSGVTADDFAVTYGELFDETAEMKEPN